MKRQIVTGLAILAVAAGMGWKLASHPETSAGLQDISLNQHSEHSNPGSTNATARIRIRLMPSDPSTEIGALTHRVPQIALTAE